MIIFFNVVALREHYIQIQIYTSHISSGDSLTQQTPIGSLKLSRETSHLMQKLKRQVTSDKEV